MLTSAGGILALLKDQNQVQYKFMLVIQYQLIDKNCTIKPKFDPRPHSWTISGGAVEGTADPVRLEEAWPGGRRVLGRDLWLDPDHRGDNVASIIMSVEHTCPRLFPRMISTLRRSVSRLHSLQARFLLIIIESFCHEILLPQVIFQVYYHLGSYEDSLQYALGADTLFDISDTRSQWVWISSPHIYQNYIFSVARYVETIIAKCIDSYTAKRTAGEENIDKRLETIVDRMFDRCFQHGQYRQALGIAIETRRLDVFERAVSGDQSDREVKVFCFHPGSLSHVVIWWPGVRHAFLCIQSCYVLDPEARLQVQLDCRPKVLFILKYQMRVTENSCPSLPRLADSWLRPGTQLLCNSYLFVEP